MTQMPFAPDSNESFKHTNYRVDIQALRGLAITIVLVHHAFPAQLSAGYLGVDMFFVVSGFLITGILKRSIEQQQFSFAQFYFRRAKRLLPAAYVVFLVCALLAPIFLTSLESVSFAKQLLGAVTFTGNVVLWSQTGYFDTTAAAKPLLHVWSLGIEEQYYLLIPIALAFTPRQWWMPAAIVAGMVSLLLCLMLGASMPAATFYLLPTRAWEMAIGSVGALAALGGRGRAVLCALFWPALAALILVPFANGNPYPDAKTLSVCVATLIVILRRHPLCNTGPIPKLLATVGAISYSLYLVHWPVFSFASNAFVTAMPDSVRGSLVVVSILLAYILYRWVELPVRAAEWEVKPLYVAAAGAFSLLLVGLAAKSLFVVQAGVDYANVRRPNSGFGVECQSDDRFVLRSECRNRDAPKILVWGDSFAEHLISGIEVSSDAGVAQATKSVCGPFLGVAPIDKGYYPQPWGEQCIKFNDSVIEFLQRDTTIEAVVLSSPISQYIGNARWDDHFSLLVRQGTERVIEERSVNIAIAAMKRTIQAIRAAGKRVVVVAPPPISDFDIGRCLERFATQKLTYGFDAAECKISYAKYQRVRVEVVAFLKELSRTADVAVINFDELLCDEVTCKTRLNGKFVYRDNGHFSYEGSREIGVAMGLASRITAQAR